MPRLMGSDIASVGEIYTLSGIVVVVVLVLGAFGGLFYWLMHREHGEGETYKKTEKDKG